MLYFANDGDTVLRETRIVKYDAGGGLIPVPTRAYVLISLHYDVSYLVDLTDAGVQKALKLEDNVLRGEWEVDILNGKNPLTQDIGHAARAAGIEAIIVPSARNLGYKHQFHRRSAPGYELYPHLRHRRIRPRRSRQRSWNEEEANGHMTESAMAGLNTKGFSP